VTAAVTLTAIMVFALNLLRTTNNGNRKIHQTIYIKIHHETNGTLTRSNKNGYLLQKKQAFRLSKKLIHAIHLLYAIHCTSKHLFPLPSTVRTSTLNLITICSVSSYDYHILVACAQISQYSSHIMFI